MSKLQTIPVAVKVLPLYLIIAALLAIPVLQHLRHQQVLAESVTEISQKLEQPLPPTPTKTIIASAPSRIVIPKIGIDLTIVPGTYDSSRRQWSVADREANFVTNSAPANNNTGTTIIYGHALVYVFGKTKLLTPGDTVYLYGESGAVFEYRYRDSKAVSPTNVSVFNEEASQPTLLLMTCDGRWSQFRRAMYLDFVRAAQ